MALEANTILKELLDDTLDVTRFEQGRCQLHLSRVSLPALARLCVGLVQPSATRKGIELRLRVEEAVETSAECLGDHLRLQQVALNLLTNAIKFTPEGGKVLLSLGTYPQLAASGTSGTSQGVESAAYGQGSSSAPSSAELPLLLQVCDSGIGIDPEEYELLF